MAQNWGYQEAAYDLNVNQGCLIYRLFLRTLPNHFKSNSIYAHYPMTVPDGRMFGHLEQNQADVVYRKSEDHEESWSRTRL